MTTLIFKQPGGQIAYDDAGAGPLVICAPSLGDMRAEYRFLAPQLVTAGYRVVTVDLRGLGESSTGWDDYSVAGVGADLLALIRQLDAGPAVVVGTSMAAGAAVWAAAEAPDAVAGLVLIGPFVRGATSWLNAALYSLLFAQPWGAAAWGWYYGTLYPTAKPADFAAYVAALRANLRESGRLAVLRQMLFASKAASEARLDQVKAPVHVIMGTKDPDFKDPAAEAKWVAERLNGQATMVPDAGHYPHAEMPTVTGPIILDFLAAHLPESELLHV
jgi:pimeloyl-ACP methyl ester carboxylesterase